MHEFKMPSLGADMEAGTLMAWKKGPGDRVARGELIAEVETDKGIIEVESFAAGIIDRLMVEVGQKVPVGTVLALIRDESDSVPAAGAATGPAPAAPTAHAPATGAPPGTAHPQGEPPAPTGHLAMAPSARRLARELGIDPATVAGTGHGGAITREDVMRAAETRQTPLAAAQAPAAQGPAAAARPAADFAPPAPAPLAPPAPAVRGGMRQAIAAAMARSKREIPHYYLATTIDLQPAWNWLAEENLKRPITQRLLHGVLFLKAVALALREVPELNALWEGGAAVQKPGIHLGVAIALRQGGLIAPALHNADQKPIGVLMEEFRDLVNRARGGRLRSSELADPTITVTSLGEQGVDTVYGVIYPPQTAIVGFGKVVERPWSRAGGLMSRMVVNATLAADHRVTDGHQGGRFLSIVDRLLQEPQNL